MPFTPLHMGPGLLVRGSVRAGFSLMVFGWTQVLIDLEPLYGMLTGRATLHGWSHTWIGATLIAVVAALSGRPLGEWGLRRLRWPQFLPITALAAWSGALAGAWSHVVLDSVMHFDIQPLRPFSTGNGLRQIVSLQALHLFCLVTAGIGGLLFLRRNGNPFAPGGAADRETSGR